MAVKLDLRDTLAQVPPVRPGTSWRRRTGAEKHDGTCCGAIGSFGACGSSMGAAILLLSGAPPPVLTSLMVRSQRGGRALPLPLPAGGRARVARPASVGVREQKGPRRRRDHALEQQEVLRGGKLELPVVDLQALAAACRGSARSTSAHLFVLACGDMVDAGPSS